MGTSLAGKVTLVAGATRGAGRGIAVELGSAGATVYVTGRSTRSHRSEMDRPENIDETAELVEALADRVATDHGHLDVLVNDIWGGDPLTGDWSKPFWEHSLADGLRMQRLGVETHLVTSWHLAPLLIAAVEGLVIEITDGVDPGYRENLFYDLAKSQVIRLALAQAGDFKPHGVTVVALTPGFLRSEAMLDLFGVTEANWRDGAAKDPHFILSETPGYVGRAAAALAADPDRRRWTGLATSSWQLASTYGVVDRDGTRPDWGLYFEEVVLGGQPLSDAHRIPATPAGPSN